MTPSIKVIICDIHERRRVVIGSLSGSFGFTEQPLTSEPTESLADYPLSSFASNKSAAILIDARHSENLLIKLGGSP
jgi:hypothetical protein